MKRREGDWTADGTADGTGRLTFACARVTSAEAVDAFAAGCSRRRCSTTSSSAAASCLDR